MSVPAPNYKYFDSNTFAPFKVPERDGEVFKCKNCGGPNKLDADKCCYCDYYFKTPPVKSVETPNMADVIGNCFSSDVSDLSMSYISNVKTGIAMSKPRDTLTFVLGGLMSGLAFFFLLDWMGGLRFFGL